MLIKPEMLPLNFLFSEEDNFEYKSDKATYNKAISAIDRASKKRIIQKNCLICNKPCSSFCNSHSIPRFCLRNISQDGKVLTTAALIDIPYVKDELGLNNSGTFRLICNQCDQMSFLDYEEPNNYENKPNQKMLSQIALKTYLKEIYKKNSEIALFEEVQTLSVLDISQRINITKQDLKDALNEFTYAKKSLNCNIYQTPYYLCYYQKLDYVVPIATQTKICLITDFDRNTINNIYDYSDSFELKDLHICVFPLEKASIIMMFIKDGETKYRSFYKRLNSFKLEDQLKIISYILFAYTEDIYISKEIEALIKSKDITDTFKKSTFTTDFANPIELAKSEYNLMQGLDFPNLFSKDLAMNKVCTI